ncbi:TfdA family taurine dioxygenase [Cylindrobasidium torrendii FP15055 ss-10]|uniref:TfdA family taurine dioxygenase n=1 Tax=Cylindrobasidium torrendii FP15055 ss-10 TaxID=1314674 RepID=A0A0D7BDS8_9AGAR|nr:TfdA family taurine dioxygenase [Cylindrobasidium torrendii FP15055 ss-10]
MVKAPHASAFLGSLSAFEAYDVTPHIGTRFPSTATQLSAILKDDEKVKDLAHLVSQRGVVFFTNQDLEIQDQKELGYKLGKLSWSGHPETSGLHVHPISEDLPELGRDVGIITSKGGIAAPEKHNFRSRASKDWHSDVTFEPIPSDYAILKMHTLPEVGGDTLWASAYEAYDRLSPAFQKFLEGLTAYHNGGQFNVYAKTHNLPIQQNRGSPVNSGDDLSATHPIIRTNPVTGYRGLFVNKAFTKRIVELSPDESDNVLQYLFRHISENHDLQVRYRWEQNDIAIWDNRSTFHTATKDYGNVLRSGNRIASLGERPFFDPNSKSRREVLNIQD